MERSLPLCCIWLGSSCEATARAGRSLTTLIVGLVLLVGGCVVVGWLAVRLFLQAKREEKALEQETAQLHAAAAQENLKDPENSEE